MKVFVDAAMINKDMTKLIHSYPLAPSTSHFYCDIIGLWY